MHASRTALLLALVCVVLLGYGRSWSAEEVKPEAANVLPKLLDLGSVNCIPCKAMAPILEGLKKEYAGQFDVEFIDVNERANAAVALKYKIELIPTQIFLDANGKELFRHQGFFGKDEILAKWKELKYDFKPAAAAGTGVERWEPAKADTRAKEAVCYMCDGDIAAKTLTVVQTPKGEVRLCGPHCYFIMYSCLTEDKSEFEKKVTVTDWASGTRVTATAASYLYGAAENGRPTIKAFASKEAALRERAKDGGNVVTWAVLRDKELATRCGFCDRAVYQEDAALVKVGGLYSWGCCSHCALGVAARTGKDIEVHQRDGSTGQEIIVKTFNGSVASLEPATAIAWFGLRKNAEGIFGSAGCFHQGFFVNQENLKKWVEARPYETGRQITIQQALADKMKLSAEQITKACKIGECKPK